MHKIHARMSPKGCDNHYPGYHGNHLWTENGENEYFYFPNNFANQFFSSNYSINICSIAIILFENKGK